MTAGFKIAERAYACAVKGAAPNLETCPPGGNRSGLAWGITPADDQNEAPELVVKDGGVPAYSSEIFLMPQRGLAVVVLVNSRSPGTDGEGHFAFRPAEALAANIGYNLQFALPRKATR